jgi:SAM-dependent methyltransferase
MTAWRFARRWSVALVLFGVSAGALAQAAAKPESGSDFQPEVGQQGKDVVWVPSPEELVQKMLDMAKVTSKDIVMDLGSGDGRTVIAAARRGAHATGIEYNPDMVQLSRRNAQKAGVSDRARFENADLFKTDLSKASVITMFLLTDINLRLRPTLLRLKPGTRVVSNTFRMGDWDPDETAELGCNSYCTAYLWIVPARVDGSWKAGQGDLVLKQKYQTFGGTLAAGGKTLAVQRGRLHGDQISFVAGGAEYRGRVGDDAIEGTVKSGGKSEHWKATR